MIDGELEEVAQKDEIEAETLLQTYKERLIDNAPKDL